MRPYGPRPVPIHRTPLSLCLESQCIGRGLVSSARPLLMPSAATRTKSPQRHPLMLLDSATASSLFLLRRLGTLDLCCTPQSLLSVLALLACIENAKLVFRRAANRCIFHLV